MNNSTNNIDPYKVLGVEKNCTETDIKKAFKKKSIKLHPDRNKAPDAQERFQELGSAQSMLMDLQDPQLKRAYQRGGWDMVNMLKQRRDAMEQQSRVCPPFGIQLPVSLRQVVQRKKLKISQDIPVLDDKGAKKSNKKFELELEMDPDALGKKQVVQHQGIERPDYVTGDIVIELDINWNKEPTKFEINNGDLIYRHVLNPLDAFGAFYFSFLHPDGKTYVVSDYYDHPEDDGEQIYIVTGSGLTDNDNLLVVVSIDHKGFSSIRKNKTREIATVKSLCCQKIPKVQSPYFDVAANSMTPEAYKTHMMAQRQRMMSMHGGMPQFMMRGSQNGAQFVQMNGDSPGECHQQ